MHRKELVFHLPLKDKLSGLHSISALLSHMASASHLTGPSPRFLKCKMRIIKLLQPPGVVGGSGKTVFVKAQ